ncbi:nose resistant to fluoxetine protein 6-like [Portunus trituberculatus]|nr:nose resistant to fluoxetine protein 6-like [Portunus trituberculatus]
MKSRPLSMSHLNNVQPFATPLDTITQGRDPPNSTVSHSSGDTRTGRMEGRWRVAAVVLVAAAGLLTVTQAEEKSSLKSFWPPPKDLNIDFKNMDLNSGERAAKAARKLHRLLLGSEDTRAGLNSVLGMYLPSINPIVVRNLECISDVIGVLRVWADQGLMNKILSRGSYWPIFLPDSWGKVPDGILYGNVLPWGMQEECTMIRANEHIPINETKPAINMEFRGRYCLVSVGMIKNEKPETLRTWEGEFMSPDVQVGVAMTDPNVLPIFNYGTCMPSTCSAEDLEASINSILKPVGKMAKHVDCHIEDEPNYLNTGDIVFVVILSVLGSVMLLATVIDLSINYYDTQELRKGPLSFLLVFSMYTNMKNTFAIKLKEHPDVISCLHGLRVFTMVWVVWGHGYMMQANVTKNLVHYKELSQGVLNQIIMNASYSVDTFLFMSGLLVAYTVLLEKDKARGVNWIMYYIHRFIRLSPPIVFTAAASATVFRFIMNGPNSHAVERNFVEPCREKWWADSIFINNFLEHPTCLPQCWYTAVDFQLFAVAPLVLAPLLTNSFFSLVWLFLVTVTSVAVPIINIAVYNLVPPGLPFLVNEEERKANVDLYMMPWARASSYLMGIWTAWLLVRVRNKGFKMPPVVVVLGWVVSAAIALAVLFGRQKVSQVVSILYGGLSRLAWGVSLLWVVFACHTGYGGIMNSILSHPSLQPLSRLTYSLFLVTIPIQIFYTGAIYMPLYVNHLTKIIETCGYLFIGGLVGIPLTLAVERPILGLEKIIFPRKGRGIIEKKVEEKKQE